MNTIKGTITKIEQAETSLVLFELDNLDVFYSIGDVKDFSSFLHQSVTLEYNLYNSKRFINWSNSISAKSLSTVEDISILTPEYLIPDVTKHLTISRVPTEVQKDVVALLKDFRLCNSKKATWFELYFLTKEGSTIYTKYFINDLDIKNSTEILSRLKHQLVLVDMTHSEYGFNVSSVESIDISVDVNLNSKYYTTLRSVISSVKNIEKFDARVNNTSYVEFLLSLNTSAGSPEALELVNKLLVIDYIEKSRGISPDVCDIVKLTLVFETLHHTLSATSKAENNRYLKDYLISTRLVDSVKVDALSRRKVIALLNGLDIEENHGTEDDVAMCKLYNYVKNI